MSQIQPNTHLNVLAEERMMLLQFINAQLKFKFNEQTKTLHKSDAVFINKRVFASFLSLIISFWGIFNACLFSLIKPVAVTICICVLFTSTFQIMFPLEVQTARCRPS